MKRLVLLLLILTTPVAIMAQGGYRDILKSSIDSVKKDSRGEVVKIANLDSNPRQNDTSSVRPIRESDVMFKVRLWSKINFNEKINSNFTSYESNLINVIYEGIDAYFVSNVGDGSPALDTLIKQGLVIVPYAARDEGGPLYPKSNFIDPERTALDEDGFSQAITNLDFKGQNFTDTGVRDRWETEVVKREEFRDLTGQALTNKAEELFNANQAELRQGSALRPDNDAAPTLDQIVVEEDLLFDKNHSTPMWDIISITVYSPSTSGSQSGLFKIEYRQLKNYIERVYKESKGEKGFWFNTRNPGDKGLSFSDAIDKRLFNSFIVSVENVDNSDLLSSFAQGDEYNSLLFAEKIRLQLLERMHNLWEY